jgi:hypothetical protein
LTYRVKPSHLKENRILFLTVAIAALVSPAVVHLAFKPAIQFAKAPSIAECRVVSVQTYKPHPRRAAYTSFTLSCPEPYNREVEEEMPGYANYSRDSLILLHYDATNLSRHSLYPPDQGKTIEEQMMYTFALIVAGIAGMVILTGYRRSMFKTAAWYSGAELVEANVVGTSTVQSGFGAQIFLDVNAKSGDIDFGGMVPAKDYDDDAYRVQKRVKVFLNNSDVIGAGEFIRSDVLPKYLEPADAAD